MQTLKYLFFTFFSFTLAPFAAGKIPSISILTPANNLKSTVARFAIEDCLSLLHKACQCDVRLNNMDAQILIELPNIETQKPVRSRFEKPDSTFKYLPIENEDYSWYSQRIDDGILLQLQAASYEALSHGLYGLLQEQLWFSFYHPIETHIPNLQYWPLSEAFFWHAQTRFDKRGFQLNTLQQIELTDALLNPLNSEAEQQMIQYIDWLARNGQNYFEFILTNKIDTLNWSNNIQQIIDYSHTRGIKIGLTLAFDKKAEAAYRLSKNKWYQSSKSKQKEIAKNLHPICKNNWDIINIFWERDYGKDKKISKRQTLAAHAQKYIDSTAQAYVFFQYTLGNNLKLYSPSDSQALALNLKKGYAFENTDAKDLLKNKQAQNPLSQTNPLRETWFMERLSQGRGFDHTQAFLLLPYLNHIWHNVQENHALGIRGNIAQSNGWEWGYWIMDWSIARWNWQHTYNNQPYSIEPTQYLGEIFKREKIANLFALAQHLQDSFLVQKGWMSYLYLDTLATHFPSALSPQILPPSQVAPHWLAKKAKSEDISQIQDTLSKPLMQLGKQLDSIVNALAKEEILLQDLQLRALLGEYIRALKVTALRIKHKAHLLDYLASKRLVKLGKSTSADNAALAKASQLRQEALKYIQLQEYIYRYEKEKIARPYQGFTIYGKGYLQQTENLDLWQAEEVMYEKGKFKTFQRKYLKVKAKLGLKK